MFVIALIALVIVLWYSDLNLSDRVAIVDGWIWITNVVALISGASLAWNKFARGSSVRAYGNKVPVTPNFQSDTEISLYKIPSGVLIAFGGSISVLGFIILGQRIFSGEPVGLMTFPTLWLCLGLGFLLSTIRYSAVLSTIGPRIVYRYGILGLTIRRIKDLGTSITIRIRREVYLEYDKRHRPQRIEDVSLDVIDGSKTYVLNYDASAHGAERVASFLGLSSFEEVLLDYSEQEEPAGLTRLAQAPPVSLNDRIPAGFWLMTLFALGLPWMFKGALVLENSPAAQAAGARWGSRFDPYKLLMTNTPPKRSPVARRASIGSPEASKALDFEKKHGMENRNPDEEARADYQRALEIWESLLGQDPTNPDNAYFIGSRGRLRLRLGQLKEGLEDLEVLRKAHPNLWKNATYGNCPLPIDLLAYSYWKAGDFDQALSVLESRTYGDSAIHGLVLTEFERWEEAERYLEDAGHRNGVDVEALELLRERLATRKARPVGH